MQPFELNLPEDIDPDLASVIEKMNKHYSEQVQLLQQGQQEFSRQYQESTAKAQADAEAQQTADEHVWLDEQFSQLKDQHSGAFGDGPYNDQPPEVQAARKEVAGDYYKLGATPKDATAFDKSVGVSRFPTQQQYQQQARAELNGKVKKQSAQRLGTPQARVKIGPGEIFDGEPEDNPALKEAFNAYEN